jgi:hypothetical protein
MLSTPVGPMPHRARVRLRAITAASAVVTALRRGMISFPGPDEPWAKPNLPRPLLAHLRRLDSRRWPSSTAIHAELVPCGIPPDRLRSVLSTLLAELP